MSRLSIAKLKIKYGKKMCYFFVNLFLIISINLLVDEEWLLVESRTKSRYIVEKKTLYI